jgi:hypothetical protein
VIDYSFFHGGNPHFIVNSCTHLDSRSPQILRRLHFSLIEFFQQPPTILRSSSPFRILIEGSGCQDLSSVKLKGGKGHLLAIYFGNEQGFHPLTI